VATGLWELARATGLGLRAEADRIRVLEPGGSFCAHLRLDPLGVISSGSLLICVEPGRADAVRLAVEATGVACEEPMPTFPQDEIARLWQA